MVRAAYWAKSRRMTSMAGRVVWLAGLGDGRAPDPIRGQPPCSTPVSHSGTMTNRRTFFAGGRAASHAGKGLGSGPLQPAGGQRTVSSGLPGPQANSPRPTNHVKFTCTCGTNDRPHHSIQTRGDPPSPLGALETLLLSRNTNTIQNSDV